MAELSIIVPVYNVEKYLDRCIKSILNQTFTDFELILVNDGSLDNCPSMCDDWAKKDNRIIVIHKDNGGLSSARNAGIDASSAPFITFVDSDDWLKTDILMSAMLLQKKHNADLVEFNFVKVFTDMKTEKIEQQNQNVFTISGEELISRIYQNVPEGITSVWGKIFKIEVFKNIRFAEGRIHEDRLILPEILYLCKRCVVTNQIGYCYNKSNENSITHQAFSLKDLDKDYAFQCNRDFYVQNNLIEAKLWSDTTYAFVLIKLIKDLKEEYGSNNKEYKELKNKFKKLFFEFIKNPLFIWKQKVLLVWYRLTL